MGRLTPAAGWKPAVRRIDRASRLSLRRWASRPHGVEIGLSVQLAAQIANVLLPAQAQQRLQPQFDRLSLGANSGSGQVPTFGRCETGRRRVPSLAGIGTGYAFPACHLAQQLGGRCGADIMVDAWECDDRRKRMSLARKALKVSPLCADAYTPLAQGPRRRRGKLWTSTWAARGVLIASGGRRRFCSDNILAAA